MNLQNGYKVIYEKITDNKRAFYATQTGVCNPEVDSKIVEVNIGDYKLIYEKDGQIYGSVTGIPADGDHCFAEFDGVFKEAAAEPALASEEPAALALEEPVADEPTIEEPAKAYTRRTTRKVASTEEPAAE